jgi:sec-independent protein translocase protein TatA
MPFRLGPLELVIILAIIIAIFGAGKLASLGGALGKGVKDFKAAVKDEETEEEGKDKPASDTKA